MKELIEDGIAVAYTATVVVAATALLIIGLGVTGIFGDHL
jgi:hypothetical protein